MNDTTQAANTTAPLDLATMREAVDRLLDPDAVPHALPPVGDELPTLTLQIKGHLHLLIPELEQAAEKLPPGSVRRYTLRQILWEARSRLEAEPSSRYGGALGYTRRLARVLNMLCDQFEALPRA